jgi:hypothetical protein
MYLFRRNTVRKNTTISSTPRSVPDIAQSADFF